jgi:hypothetical protein
MSFFDAAKKALIKDSNAKPAKPETPPVKTTSTDYVSPLGTATVMSASGVLDVPGITADIETAIQSSGEFAWYNKFAEQMESLKAIKGMDEPTRYQAAAATLRVSGADLLASVMSYEAVLKSSSDRFEAEFVASAKAEIAGLTEKIKAAEARIEELTQQLGAASQDKASLVTTSQERVVDLGKADVDFKGIVSTLTTKYRGLAAKVQQYLGAENAK